MSRHRHIYLRIVLPFLVFAIPAFGHAADDPLAQLTRQVREYLLLGAAGETKRADAFAASLGAEGAWADIDYQSKNPSTWATARHIERVLIMTRALENGGLSAEQQGRVTDAIHRALACWRQHDYICPNWWFNNISVPQTLGSIAVLLGEQLRPEELDYLAHTVMPRAAIGMTGQNRVWLAGNTLLAGVLQRDESTVARAAQAIFAEMVVTEREGIQPDASFHQHGAQLQFGNYGLGFATEQVKWMTILRGTPWAMPEEKLAIFRRYLLDGLNWTLYRGAMDISACGRQLSPGSPQSKARSIVRVMSQMAELDPAHAADYRACAARNKGNGANDLLGTRYFWRSDYLVHRCPDYCATLKMCSSRVIGTESLNGENLSGYHLADGALYLYRSGEDYADLFPAWDWRKLPGVTCAQPEGGLPKCVNYKLETNFAGAATDGENGCAALDYRRDGVSAHKAWFFAGEQIACLGSGIRAEAAVTAPVVTTVNQCRLHGEVRVMTAAGMSSLAPGVQTFHDLTWVEHDGMRYEFPPAQTVTLSAQAQTGNWAKVFQTEGTPKDDVTAQVFALWLEHGITPAGGSYAYFLRPTNAPSTHIEVLANTEALQAVRFGEQLVEAVFTTPGHLDYAPGHSLSVTAPCTLLLDLHPTPPHLTLADPTQTRSELSGELDGNAWQVILPEKGERGTSVKVNL